MSFIAVRLPECVALGAVGGPEFNTHVVTTDGGIETRNQIREFGLGRWEVAHVAKRPEVYVPLRNFFVSRGGQFGGFLFKDYLDYTVETGEGIFIALTATTFQMYKQYLVDGVAYYVRMIQKPVSGTVTVSGTSIVGQTISYTTGIVTVISGTPTSWVGEFDCACRFGTDRLVQLQRTRSRNPRTGVMETLVDWDSIPIIEVRV